jgi:hypothetical protein
VNFGFFGSYPAYFRRFLLYGLRRRAGCQFPPIYPGLARAQTQLFMPGAGIKFLFFSFLSHHSARFLYYVNHFFVFEQIT